MENKAPEAVINKQGDYLSKLHESLDNLIIDQRFTIDQIDKIKIALPLSTVDQLVLNLDNIGSRNPKTRITALFALIKSYDSEPNHQVSILKAMIIMLNDNTGAYNGYQALGNIQIFVQKGKINDASKIQTMVDGLANYLKNPGAINYTSIIAENDNMRVLNGMIEVVLPEFLTTCKTEIKEQKVDLTPLEQSLQVLYNNVPNGTLTESFKNKVASVYEDLRLI